jgi:hypothetical protein
VPVRAGEAVGAFVPILVVIVVAKLGSSPRAAASSLRVFNVAGEESIKLLTAVLTKSVVAIRVLELPAVGVGAVGDPVSAGEARGALVAIAVLAVVMSVSLVAALEVTEATPAAIAACVKAVVAKRVLVSLVDCVGAVGAPVRAGEAIGALVATTASVATMEASVASIAIPLAKALATTEETPATIAACVKDVVAI